MSMGFTFQYCFHFHHNFPHVFSSSPVHGFHFHFPILLSLSSYFSSCILILTCPCAEFLSPWPATGSWTELGIVPLMQIFTLAPWEMNDMVPLPIFLFNTFIIVKSIMIIIIIITLKRIMIIVTLKRMCLLILLLNGAVMVTGPSTAGAMERTEPTMNYLFNIIISLSLFLILSSSLWSLLDWRTNL